jgi:zinc transport system permease protein
MLLFYRQLLSLSFDQNFATVRNVPVGPLYLAMITLIGLTVVIAMRVVGLIMVIALLTIPPAIANLYLKDMRAIMAFSAALSMLFCTVGLIISYVLNFPSGAVIILVAGLAYVLAAIIRSLLLRRQVPEEGIAVIG